MKKIWLLISVKRGFIQEPEIFYDEISAKNQEKKLLKEHNPDYDELEIFEKMV